MFNTKFKKTLMVAVAMMGIVSFAYTDGFSRWGRGGGSGGCGGSGYTERSYHGHYGRGGFGHMGYLRQDLGLSEKQVKKIEKIDSKFSDKYYKNRGNYDKILETKIEHRKAIKAVLNSNQKKKFNDTFSGRRGNRYRNCPFW